MLFDNTYARLPEAFFQRINPIPVAKPYLISFNHSLADEMGLELQDDADSLAQLFSGNTLLDGMAPIAMAYAGHQFGGFVSQLGDGRAILLGEAISDSGKRYDIHLKGSGRTRFSRNGDGRSALGPVIREYIVSEAMHAMGIPTTRALAMVTTGENVVRETLKPGGIFTRVASGLVRVGTFEFFAARQDWDAVKVLADYVIERHYPEAKTAENPYVEFYRMVCAATARLVAKWMAVGFIHGVMNTDNTSIAGETIDYGPCAFMDTYVPDKVFSSIDMHGRYAYNNQPTIAQWNMAALGGCLVKLFHDDDDKAKAIGEEVLEGFIPVFKEYYQTGMCHKIGLDTCETQDFQLVRDLMLLMEQDHADFTVAFRSLSDDLDSFRGLFDGINPWLEQWKNRLNSLGKTVADAQRGMLHVNPAIIPRNHRIEEAIRAAEDEGNFAPTLRLIEVLKNPYEVKTGNEGYRSPPKSDEIVHQTFCGT